MDIPLSTRSLVYLPRPHEENYCSIPMYAIETNYFLSSKSVALANPSLASVARYDQFALKIPDLLQVSSKSHTDLSQGLKRRKKYREK